MTMKTRAMRASTSKVTLEAADTSGDEDRAEETMDAGDKVGSRILTIEGHISQLVKSLRALKKDAADLRRRNQELEEDLKEAREEVENQSQPKPGKRGGASNKQLQTKVASLRKQVAELERRRERDKKKIAQLRAKEIKKDAEDLQDQTEFEVGDSAHKMRKLLRRFHDIMLASSIADEEECPICMTEMSVGNALSFTCEHTFCKACTSKLAPGYAESVSCPSCRKEVPKEDMETVEYTASQQWDALLDVARKWARIDHRREMETSDEEAEEQFIDDDNDASEARSVSSKAEAEQPEIADTSSPPPVSGKGRLKRRAPARAPSVASSIPGEEEIGQDQEQEHTDADGRLSTPQPESGTSQAEPRTPTYAQSPAGEKRRRLQELAESRQKRRRI